MLEDFKKIFSSNDLIIKNVCFDYKNIKFIFNRRLGDIDSCTVNDKLDFYYKDTIVLSLLSSHVHKEPCCLINFVDLLMSQCLNVNIKELYDYQKNTDVSGMSFSFRVFNKNMIISSYGLITFSHCEVACVGHFKSIDHGLTLKMIRNLSMRDLTKYFDCLNCLYRDNRTEDGVVIIIRGKLVPFKNSALHDLYTTKKYGSDIWRKIENEFDASLVKCSLLGGTQPYVDKIRKDGTFSFVADTYIGGC